MQEEQVVVVPAKEDVKVQTPQFPPQFVHLPLSGL